MSFVDVIVVRGDGDIDGGEVSDPLLTSEGVAVERGRNLIDSNSPIRPTAINVLYRSGIEVGQTVRVLDSSLGAVWYGKIRRMSFSLEGVELGADLEVERVV